MSNIYIQEPPTSGKVIFHTTVGPIDIELWSKETPKACRNFVQLALEGYYDGTIFHRVIKGMCVQGGDPTGTGEGGKSIYGKPFKDEIHSRLRFNRRGLVAMASSGKNDNTSQFFFTLGASPHLNGKHTIFGKIAGDTVYNMLKLEEGDVDEDDRPEYPQKIRTAEVTENPFPDIVPRKQETPKEQESTKSKKPQKPAAKKDFKLLSFGSEAEEEDFTLTEINEKHYRGKSKSSHDLLKDDKTLSADPAVVVASSKQNSPNDEHSTSGKITRIRDKLQSTNEKAARSESGKRRESRAQKHDSDDERDVNVDNYFEEERKRKASKEAEEHRKEYKQLRKEMKANEQKSTGATDSKSEPESKLKSDKDVGSNDWLASFYAEQNAYSKSTAADLKKIGQSSREAQTLAMVAKFKSSLLQSISEERGSSDDDDKTWVAHELRFEDKAPVLAKDATTQKEEMYDITDPRHPLNARKRQKSTQGHSERHRSRR